MSFRSLTNAVLASLLAQLVSGCLCAQGARLQKAPPNPDFVEWQARQREKRAEARAQGAPAQAADEVGRRFGFVPPPFRYQGPEGPVTEIEVKVREGARAYPPSYDLRALDLVTPVRDQNPFGTCWAFAAYGSLESNIKRTTGTAMDFSEWQTAWFAYTPVNGMPAFTRGSVGSGEDRILDQGGSTDMALALAARGTGPASETSAPYQNNKNYAQSSLPRGDEPNVATVLGMHSFQRGDSDAIKGLVQTNGALAVSMLWPERNESRYYSSANSAFRYVQGGSYQSNHVVCIVGWDDAFPRDKFPADNQPLSDGAWIARNSWGASWGSGGYFYVSYDTSLEYFDSFVGTPALDKRTYQYDYLGLVSLLGYGGYTAWFSNIFTATSNDPVTDVAFYAGAANASYEISVRTGVGSTPDTGTLAVSSQRGTLALAGYHRVNLQAPVSVAAGQRFAVIVKLTTPSYRYQIPIQYPYEGYSDSVTAEPGVGFSSSNGTAWEDIKSIPDLGMDNVSVCLKAFSVTLSIEISDPPPVVFTGETVRFQARVSGASSSGVIWTASVPGVIDASGNFTAPPGAQMITVTATAAADASLRDSVHVSVRAAPDGGTSRDPQLLGFANAYGGTGAAYDFNGDGTVDDKDLLALFRGMGW